MEAQASSQLKQQMIQGDCLEVMKTYPDNHFSGIVTDPPYGLHFMGKDWDKFKSARLNRELENVKTDSFGRGKKGRFDSVDTAPSFKAGTYDESRNDEFQEFMYKFAVEALRICKPGAFILMCGAPRRFHRQACGLEDAGWEIRDCISWLYGSGFPKSLNISKAIDKANGCEREVLGIDPNIHSRGSSTSFPKRPTEKTCEESGRVIPQTADRAYLSAPTCDLAKQFDGYGTALKPAWEPIIMAMKPCEGTFAQNAEKWAQAGINVDECRIPGLGDIESNPVEHKLGRWPANLILDEEAAALLDEQSGICKPPGNKNNSTGTKIFGSDVQTRNIPGQNCYPGECGGANRFFYCAKASSAERNRGCEELPKCENDFLHGGLNNPNFPDQNRFPKQNSHPTVKPLKLMEYLIKLISPPKDAIILDPFAGSGTTLLACKNLGVDCIGIEKSADYCEIANARLT